MIDFQKHKRVLELLGLSPGSTTEQIQVAVAEKYAEVARDAKLPQPRTKAQQWRLMSAMMHAMAFDPRGGTPEAVYDSYWKIGNDEANRPETDL